VFSCIGRGPCYELKIRPKKSYDVSNKIKKLKNGGQGPAWALKATDDDLTQIQYLLRHDRRSTEISNTWFKESVIQTMLDRNGH
jgi:hypothetical protein